MLASIEILNWCKEHKYFYPEYLACLLSKFTPDLDELNSWNIKQLPTDGVSKNFEINDTYYEVRSLADIVEELDYYKQSIIQDSKEEIPEEYRKYIDWDKFFKDNPITINMFVEDLEHITFCGVDYYIYGD